MELNIKKEALSYYEGMEESPTTFEVTQEAIVPDYCADVARVVDTEGTVLIHNKEMTTDGRIEVNGVIKASILFVAEGSQEVGAVHISVPFHTFCDSRQVSQGDPFLVEGSLRSIDTRMLNPRKLLTRGDVALKVTVFKEEQRILCQKGENMGEDLQLLEDTATASVIVDVMEREFRYTDELTLSASRREMQEILTVRTAITPADAKIIGNKLVLKGIVTSEVLYLDTAGELGTLRGEFLFSQVMDTSCAEETGEARVSFALTGYEYTLGTEQDREDGHTVTVSLHIRSEILMLEKRRLTFLSDLYSTHLEVKPERRLLKLTEERTVGEKKYPVRELLETGVSVRQVVDTAVLWGSCTTRQEGEETVLSVPITAKVLYLDENDSLLTVEKELLVGGAVEGGGVIRSYLRSMGEVMATPVPEGIEIRLTPELFVEQGVSSKKLYVCEISAEEPKEEQGRRPSIVLCKVGSSKLWDIAKQYHTTGSDILKANELSSEEEIRGDQLLLIPRKR